ncbi:MAG: hypothetical protein JRF45_13305 [Deltaproteobacteria bacterium]|nr:hypothetical protein [Deltaproteobacteria bacterium]
MRRRHGEGVNWRKGEGGIGEPEKGRAGESPHRPVTLSPIHRLGKN